MRPLILNSSNVVAGSNNSKYLYTFPGGGVSFSKKQIAISQISIYYSWFNLTAALGNNSFSYYWVDGAGAAIGPYTVTFDDGFYTVSDMNAFLQSKMVANGHYLVNSVSDYEYYLEFVENSTRYSVQFNSYPIPTALPAGWSNPAAIAFPPVASTPQIVIPSTDFRDIIGFNAGTYPSVIQATTYSKISDYTPQVSPVQSVVVLCSLLRNPYSNPNTIIHSFAPTDTTFGSIISSEPNTLIFCDIQDGYYYDFYIQFVDQSFQPLVINDSNLVIELVIKDKEKI